VDPKIVPWDQVSDEELRRRVFRALRHRSGLSHDAIAEEVWREVVEGQYEDGAKLYSPRESFRENDRVIFVMQDDENYHLHCARVTSVGKPQLVPLQKRVELRGRIISVEPAPPGHTRDWVAECPEFGSKKIEGVSGARPVVTAGYLAKQHKGQTRLQRRIQRVLEHGIEEGEIERSESAGGDADFVLAVPQRSVRVTLRSYDISRGCIHITSGVQHILDYYGLHGTVLFEAYGHYVVRAEVSHDALQGPEVAAWMREHELAAGDVVSIVSPKVADGKPRLTVVDSPKRPSGWKGRRWHRVHLRHWAYSILKESPDNARHYRWLAEEVSARGA